MEPGGVFPRQCDGQTAPGELTDNATGSARILFSGPGDRTITSVPRTRTKLCTHRRRDQRRTGCEQPSGLHRILRLCVRRIIIVERFCRSELLGERERHESTDARPLAFPRSYWAYSVSVSNLIDNLLGPHTETPVAYIASVAG